MPPAVHIYWKHDAGSVDPRPEKYESCQARNTTDWVRHKHTIYHRRATSRLWLRQYSETEHSNNPSPSAALPNRYPFFSYTPTTPLHAKIVPLGETEGFSSKPGGLPGTGIVLVAIGAVIIAILAAVGLYMTRSLIVKKSSRILRYGYRKRKAQKQIMEENPSSETVTAITMQGYDDLGWGPLTRYMYVENSGDAHHEHGTPEPEKSHDSTHTLSPLPGWLTHDPRRSPNATGSEEQVQQEADEVAPTHVLQEEEYFQPHNVEFQSVTSRSLPYLSREGNVSIFGSLQASIDELAQGLPILSIQNATRQVSGASEPLDKTTISREILDCFSAASSRTSMSSIPSIGSNFDEDSEFHYEVKHAEAKSVEIQRGVLVACRPSTSPCEYGPALPTFVISEPLPLPLCSGDWKRRSISYSIEGLQHSTTNLDMSQTGGSLASLVREGSRGTINSLSTSFSTTTRTEGWCSEEDEFLQTPVVPYLMVTRPSDSSIHTTRSIASSISIDLSEFPLPPIPVKCSYFPEHTLPRTQVWDNHSTESSVAQRVTTVQQFMTMYSHNK